MSSEKFRVLITKFGNGYGKSKMLELAYCCCMAGFEVVYSELSDPEAITDCAVQESVDHIGITTLPGANVEDFAGLFNMMKKKGINNVRVTAGGIFPENDVEKIKTMGVAEFYPGRSIYDRMEEWAAGYGGVEDPNQCARFKAPESGLPLPEGTSVKRAEP
jgi:methylmalonyl-CoA mutase C-terminal domain/subunit